MEQDEDHQRTKHPQEPAQTRTWATDFDLHGCFFSVAGTDVGLATAGGFLDGLTQWSAIVGELGCLWMRVDQGKRAAL